MAPASAAGVSVTVLGLAAVAGFVWYSGGPAAALAKAQAGISAAHAKATGGAYQKVGGGASSSGFSSTGASATSISGGSSSPTSALKSVARMSNDQAAARLIGAKGGGGYGAV
jgi:hypothetical protein